MLYDEKFNRYDPIFESLCKAGADVNIIYTESAFKAETSSEPYKCNLLLNFIRQQAHLGFEGQANTLKASMLALLNFGARLDLVDSESRDAMIYAVRSNNFNLVQFLINNKDKCKLLISL